MELHDLEGLKCPELHFVIHEIMDEEVKWGDIITPEHELFKVNHSREYLEQNIVHVPTFSDTEMLGLQYVEEKKDGSFIYHDTYCNYVGYKVEYKRGNLVKITHQFGVQVLKKSEEKYPQPIILHTVDYHFIYDYEAERWKYVETGSLDVFTVRRDYIEALRKDPLIRRITKTYFSLRKTVKASATQMTLDTTISYKAILQKWMDLIEAASKFHAMKRLFGELSEQNELFIEEKLLDLRKKYLFYIQQGTDLQLLDSTRTKDTMNTDEQKFIMLLSSFSVDIKNVFFTPGYWVYGQEVYPNACEIYNTLQIAETNRNEQTKKALKSKLIRVAKKENMHYYTLDQLSTKE